MTITLGTPARNASCNGAVDLLDAGSGTAKFRIRANTTTLCDISLPNPAFGSASVGVATAAGLPLSGTGVAAGTGHRGRALKAGQERPACKAPACIVGQVIADLRPQGRDLELAARGRDRARDVSAGP